MTFYKYFLCILFHPTQGYYLIGKKAPVGYAFILIPLACIMPVLNIYLCHYPLQTQSVRDANILIEILSVLVVVVTFIVANYAVATINDGESKFKSVLVGTAFSLLPYIIFTVPIALMSNIMCLEDIMLFQFLHQIIWIWVGILLFIQVMYLNNYSVGQTIFNIFISIICVILSWAAISILFLQVSDWYNFIKSILYEIKIMSLK